VIRLNALALDNVSRTALIPFWARVQDLQAPEPILGDTAAARLADVVAARFGPMQVSMSTSLGCCLRGATFDGWLRDLAAAQNDGRLGTIFDLGVGLDTRTERIGDIWNGYVEVDRGPVIRLRDSWLPDGRVVRVGADALDVATWIDAAPTTPGPVVVIAEAVLTYSPPAKVARFFAELGQALPGAYVLFDSPSPIAAWLANRPAQRASGRPPFLWATWRTSRIRIGGSRLKVETEHGLIEAPARAAAPFTSAERIVYRLPLMRRAFRLTKARLPLSGSVR
jgi:O-methyltransferase involved in polyketide biosynthesis